MAEAAEVLAVVLVGGGGVHRSKCDVFFLCTSSTPGTGEPLILWWRFRWILEGSEVRSQGCLPGANTADIWEESSWPLKGGTFVPIHTRAHTFTRAQLHWRFKPNNNLETKIYINIFTRNTDKRTFKYLKSLLFQYFHFFVVCLLLLFFSVTLTVTVHIT